MSITPKITIVKKQGKDFSVLAEEILVALQKSKQTIIRVLFFTNVANNNDFLQKQASVLTKSKLLFAEKTPLISIISQTPFEYDLIAEIHSTDASVTFKNAFGTNYIVAKNNEEKAFLSFCKTNL